MKKWIIIITSILIFSFILIYFVFPQILLNLTIYISRKNAGFAEKSIQVDDHRIVYLEGGQGQNILLIHGYGSEKESWLLISKYLAPEYHVIIPDLPGFGKSTKKMSADYDIASQVKRMEKFIKLLKIESVHIAGISMGGCVAGALSSVKSKVISCTLIDTFCITPPKKSEFQRELEKGGNPLLISNVNDFMYVMKLIFYKPVNSSQPVIRYLAKKAAGNRQYNHKVEKDMRKAPLDLELLLQKIKIPVLIVWGEDDKLLDKSAVSVLEKGLSRHETVIIKECGHVPILEHSKATAEFYLKFLKEI